jgi:signal transduction histidine kinase
MRNPVTAARPQAAPSAQPAAVRRRLMFPQRVGQFALADRQFGRSVLFGLALVGAMGMIGPLVAYRFDVAAIRSQFRARVAREALVHAEALGLHFQLLRAELERLALRPEVNLQDNTIEPEKLILNFTHRESALFGAGVVLLDSAGNHVWSEPKGLLADEKELGQRRWFQKVIALGSGVIEALETRSHVFAVAVPIIRGGQNTGVLLGLVDPRLKELPGAKPIGGDLELIVADRAGNVFLPLQTPPWASAPRLGGIFEGLLDSPNGDAVEVNSRDYFAAAKAVGSTGLRLMLLADEEAVIAPIRHRFLLQLLFIAMLQLFTLLLFSLYFRRTYQSFLRVETRAAEQEKMAALGSAASLIAHEVKNSLNGLKAAATVLTSGADPVLPARTILGQIDRLGHLASSLLYFGKPAAPQLVRAELDPLVSQAVETLRVLPEAEDVSLSVSLQSNAQVSCDPLLLLTALDNLIRNAIEAAVAGKDLGIVRAPAVSVSTQKTPDGVLITVEDNAGGLPAGFEEHVFEPFVTSKPKGIGLGLSMARRALEQQGALIWFHRTPAGTRFLVKFDSTPRAQASAGHSAAKEPV